MSYKERFKTSIDEYERSKAELKAGIDKFASEGTPSEDEIKENAKSVEKLHQAEVKKLKTNLTGVIADKYKELVGEPTADKDYPVRLKNLETVLERDGADMSHEMLVKALVLFTEDPIALNAIKESLIKSGKPESEVFELIPADKRDGTISAVRSIENSLDKKLKLVLGSNTDNYLGYETMLSIMDENFDYMA